MRKKSREINLSFKVNAPSNMTKEQINEEIKKIMLKKMFSQTSKEKFEDRWRREGDRIIWEMKAILMSTIIGVFLGVLTNISASFFICQQFDFGFLFLTISLILTFSFFYSWRHYLLQKTSDRLFETLSKMIEAFPSEIELSTKQDEVYDKH